MTGTNTFRSKNIQNNSGNYINNKRQKTTYREILNNNFRNVENTHFTNGGSNSHNLRISGGNNIIALQSVGGFGISAQSRRLDIARGRAFSESLFINNEETSRIIEQPDPTCQKNGNIVTTRPRRLINLSLDMNNANFLTNKQKISCQEKIKDKLKFNNRFILEPNLNLSTRILLNNDPLSNLNLNTKLEVGEENCIKTIIKLPQYWFPIRKSQTIPIEDFPIRPINELPIKNYPERPINQLPIENYPQRDIKKIPIENYPQRDIKKIPTNNFPRIESKEIPTQNYPQLLFNVPTEQYPSIDFNPPSSQYPEKITHQIPSSKYPEKITHQIPIRQYPEKITHQIPIRQYPERTQHLIPTQVQGNFAPDPERLLSLAMVLDPSTVVYNFVNRIEFNRHYTDIYTFPPNPLDLSLNSNNSYIAPKWSLPKRVDITSLDISSSYVIFNDPYEISYNLTSTGFNVSIDTSSDSILYDPCGSLITYQPDICNNWFFRINRSLNYEPYWLDNHVSTNNSMNRYNPVNYLKRNDISYIDVLIESQTQFIRRDTGFMLHNNYSDASGFTKIFKETLIGLNNLLLIQPDDQVLFAWNSSNNSTIIADLSLSTINDLINYGIVYDNNIFDLCQNYTISNNILKIKDVSENSYQDSDDKNYTTVEFSPQLFNILNLRPDISGSELPLYLRFRFLTTTLSEPESIRLQMTFVTELSNNTRQLIHGNISSINSISNDTINYIVDGTPLKDISDIYHSKFYLQNVVRLNNATSSDVSFGLSESYNFIFDPSENKTILHGEFDSSASYIIINTTEDNNKTLFQLIKNNNDNEVWNNLQNTLLNRSFYKRSNFNKNMVVQINDLSFQNITENSAFTLMNKT